MAWIPALSCLVLLCCGMLHRWKLVLGCVSLAGLFGFIGGRRRENEVTRWLAVSGSLVWTWVVMDTKRDGFGRINCRNFWRMALGLRVLVMVCSLHDEAMVVRSDLNGVGYVGALTCRLFYQLTSLSVLFCRQMRLPSISATPAFLICGFFRTLHLITFFHRGRT
jgi:hypothetical protein